MLTIKKGYLEVVTFLLKQKEIHINKKNKHGDMALLVAAQVGDIEMIKLLLQQEGIKINEKNEDGNTALMIASSNGNLELVKLLLQQKEINVNLKNKVVFIQVNYKFFFWNLHKTFHTALSYAISRHHSQVVEVLRANLNINK